MRIPIFLAIFAALSCRAQTPGAQEKGAVQAAGGGIKINVVQGEGAVNNIRSGIAAPVAVEVRDANGRPVAKAEVIFELPASGPSGAFFGWLRHQTVHSNAEGRAETTGFTPNEEAGKFTIKVTANSGPDTASVSITQTNSTTGGGGGAQAKSGHGGLWKVILIVGAAGLAGGIVAATRGSSTPPTPPTPVTISAGPITIGGPR